MFRRFQTVVIALAVAATAQAQNQTTDVQAVLEKVSPSIATVNVVLKTTMRMAGESMEEESKISLQGVVVTADGLIMVSNTPFSPKRVMEMLGGESMPAGMDYKMTPTSIKVVFGNEDREYNAFLAATDTKLDLAFIQVEGLGDRQLTPVDFGSAVDAKLGQQVLAVSRLTKSYDYAPYFALGQICGEITKPRRAWMLLGDISQLGLPLFTLNGELVGVLTTIVADVQQGEDTMGFFLLMRLLSGGGSSGTGGIFVIPGQQVKPLVEQASRRAAELAAERAKKQAEPAKPGTPASPTKPKSGGK